jgi:hypothetical protein
VGFAVMVLLGEWFCVRREMQDIPLSEWPALALELLQAAGPTAWLAKLAQEYMIMEVFALNVASAPYAVPAHTNSRCCESSLLCIACCP